MGLDNGFELRRKSTEDMIVELAYFRKFYELDDWMAHHWDHREPKEDECEMSTCVSLETLKELNNEIEPVAKELMAMGFEKVDYYDDVGYPHDEASEIKFHRCSFSPYDSRSMFPGRKLLRLYSRVNSMMELLENDRDHNLIITFYSSF